MELVLGDEEPVVHAAEHVRFRTGLCGHRPPAAGLATINTIEFRAKQPYLMQFNASVERAIMANTALTVGYVASRGYNLQRIVNTNPRTPVEQADGRLFFPPTAPFINHAFAY